MKNPRAFVIGGILTVVLVLLGVFVFYNTRDLVFGQALEVTTPTDGSTVRDPIISVTGHIAHASNISLNGGQILTDDKGVFSKIVVLAPGLNVLELASQDRFNRENKKVLRVVYRP